MNRRFHLRAAGVWSTTVALLFVWTSMGQSVAAAPTVGAYSVAFTRPLTSVMALQTLQTSGATALYVRYRYSVAGRLATGEVRVLPDRDPAARISSEHDVSLRDQITNLLAMAPSVATDTRSAFSELLTTTEAEIGAAAPDREVIIGASFVADSNALQRVLQSPIIDHVVAIGKATIARASGRRGLASRQAEAASGYVPSEGWVVIQPSSQGGRYVQQTFVWATGRSLDFGVYPTDPQGYEADFYLSTNNGTYLDSSSTFSIPNVITWNWNYDCVWPYLDSRAGDTPYANAFTIGCSDAYHMSLGTYYSTYIRTNNGDASDDRGFVTPQSQHSTSGSACTTTWCFAPTATCLIGGPSGTYPIYVPTTSYHWYITDGCY